jgi:hypothetical protein
MRVAMIGTRNGRQSWHGRAIFDRSSLPNDTPLRRFALPSRSTIESPDTRKKADRIIYFGAGIDACTGIVARWNRVRRHRAAAER